MRFLVAISVTCLHCGLCEVASCDSKSGVCDSEVSAEVDDEYTAFLAVSRLKLHDPQKDKQTKHTQHPHDPLLDDDYLRNSGAAYLEDYMEEAKASQESPGWVPPAEKADSQGKTSPSFAQSSTQTQHPHDPLLDDDYLHNSGADYLEDYMNATSPHLPGWVPPPEMADSPGKASSSSHVSLLQDRLLQSYICPFMSRHLEVWDELPDSKGFKARFGNKLLARLPAGCARHEEPLEDEGFLETGSRVIGDQFRPALVPYPKSLRLLDNSQGSFVLSKDTKLSFGPGVQDDAPYLLAATAALKKRIDEATKPLLEGSSEKASTIFLDIKQQPKMDPEGYKLTVQNREVKLEAYGPEGLSHGVNTLQQLMPLSINEQSTLRGSDSHTAALIEISASDMTDAGIILPMEIQDSPAFKWRGLHLDVSRHFFPAADVKKLLDTMAAYKLNRFHWHLTDDQGWRFPVPGYPKLVSIGAGARYKGDTMMSSGEGIEGSYTEEDIHDVLEYAKARHIQVIPEVDVPGHTAAAIAAYPELGNPDFAPPKGPQHEFGVHKWTLAPTKKSAEFLEAVFAEVARLFPDSEYIHIGGDEAPQDQWLHSSSEAKKNWELFEGSNAQSYFNNKVSGIVHKHGKKLAGWDEVQSVEGLPKDAAIFAWRGENELQKAVRAGRPVINADNGHLYLDHYQGPESSEPKAIGGPLTTPKDVYEYNPVPALVQEQDRHLILGGQAQLWSEYFPNWKQVEYMAFPRGIALAERLWTPEEELSFPDFSKRIKRRLDDLKHWGVNFHEFEF